jgi:hypothetical protein
MLVREAGQTVYFEPNALVTYVAGPPLQRSDLHYYMLRWSDDWTLKSLKRLREKWDLAEDAYFTTKYHKLGWRRKTTIIVPIIWKLTFGLYSPRLEHFLIRVEHLINHWLSDRHAKKQVSHSLKSEDNAPSMPILPDRSS